MSAIEVMLTKARRIGICLLLHCFAISLKRRINISLQPIEYCARDSSVKQTDRKKDKNKTFPIDFKKSYKLSFHNVITKFSIPFFTFAHTYPTNEKNKIPQIQKIWIDIRVVVQPQFKVNPSNRLN